MKGILTLQIILMRSKIKAIQAFSFPETNSYSSARKCNLINSRGVLTQFGRTTL
jgi:hypothetical protein